MFARILTTVCIVLAAAVFVRVTAAPRGFSCTARVSFFAQKRENFAVLLVPREEAKQLILLRAGLLLAIRNGFEKPCTLEDVGLLVEGDDQQWRRLDLVPVNKDRRVYVGSDLKRMTLVDLVTPTLAETIRRQIIAPGETIQFWGLFAGRDYPGRGRLKLELRCSDGQTHECPITVSEQPDAFSLTESGIKILEKALDRSDYQLVL